jgi:hypothetical protein
VGIGLKFQVFWSGLQPEIRPFGSEHAHISIQFDSGLGQVGRVKGFAGHLKIKNQ